MNGLQVDQVFNVFGWTQRPADVSTEPVEGEGFISTELTGKLSRETRLEWVQQGHNSRRAQPQKYKKTAQSTGSK